MSLHRDGRDPAIIDRHHQTNLVTPLPVIGSVLLDSRQALSSGRGSKKGLADVKRKIFKRCNQTALGT